MWNRDLLQIGNRIAIGLLLIAVILICGFYIAYVYNAHVLPDKQAKANFTKSTCFILGKTLTTKGAILRRYRADFLLSYNVNNIQYNRWVSGNGLDASFSLDRLRQEDMLSRFDEGSTYECYYNTANPQIAILMFRHDWQSLFPMIVPAAFIVYAVYTVLINFFSLFSLVTMRRRQE